MRACMQGNVRISVGGMLKLALWPAMDLLNHHPAAGQCVPQPRRNFASRVDCFASQHECKHVWLACSGFGTPLAA
jgi:hypothetical protein